MRNQRRDSHLLRTSTAIAASTAVALALIACGASDDNPGADGSRGNGARAELEQAALEHAECMRKQGIDVPDPKPGQGGIVLRGPAGGGDPAAQRRAMGKCQKYLRKVPPPKLSEEQKTAMRDGALRHARCMRGQGIDFPDPKFDGHGGITVELGEGFDPADPRVRRAERTCRKLLPRPGPRSAG